MHRNGYSREARNGLYCDRYGRINWPRGRRIREEYNIYLYIIYVYAVRKSRIWHTYTDFIHFCVIHTRWNSITAPNYYYYNIMIVFRRLYIRIYNIILLVHKILIETNGVFNLKSFRIKILSVLEPATNVRYSYRN